MNQEIKHMLDKQEFYRFIKYLSLFVWAISSCIAAASVFNSALDKSVSVFTTISLIGVLFIAVKTFVNHIKKEK